MNAAYVPVPSELVPRSVQRTYLREAEGASPPVRVTVVGMSPDIRQGQEDAVPVVYLPFRAEAPAAVTLIVRGSGGPARVVSAARRRQEIAIRMALGARNAVVSSRRVARRTGAMET